MPPPDTATSLDIYLDENGKKILAYYDALNKTTTIIFGGIGITEEYQILNDSLHQLPNIPERLTVAHQNWRTLSQECQNQLCIKMDPRTTRENIRFNTNKITLLGPGGHPIIIGGTTVEINQIIITVHQCSDTDYKNICTNLNIPCTIAVHNQHVNATNIAEDPIGR